MIKRPMKGVAVEDLQLIRLPCLAFPKIDGFRCVLGEHPMTSRMSPFPNKHFHKTLSGLLPSHVMLDGEVVVGKRRGKGVLQRTSSGLTSQEGEPEFTLWVFDYFHAEAPFDIRSTNAEQWVVNLDHANIRFLKYQYIDTYKKLVAYLEKCLERGFEGIITRDPKGIYKQGKSTLREQWMLKVKPFEDAEGRVTGYYEEMENTNAAERLSTGKLKRSSAKAGKLAKGTLGGLILEDLKSGVEVRVGGGFTKEQRIRLWLIKETLLGELVKYKKQTVGEKDKPRHPNFVEFIDFRPAWDMAE